MFEDEDNGHEPTGLATKDAFEGARLKLKELKEEGGLFVGIGAGQSQSLLHRVISAVKDNKQYRDELKIALWANSDEADEAVAALQECFELGMDASPILDQIIARSSGPHHELLFKTLDTLTHTTFTTNYQKHGGRDARRNTNSPIA